jgi:hypothetical protein
MLKDKFEKWDAINVPGDPSRRKVWSRNKDCRTILVLFCYYHDIIKIICNFRGKNVQLIDFRKCFGNIYKWLLLYQIDLNLNLLVEVAHLRLVVRVFPKYS